MLNYDGLEALRPIDDSTSAYDPRGREFFKATVQARGPIWTRPYTFFASPHTGITRTAPLFREGDRLHAVLTVDFDVAELSRVLETSPLPGSQTLLFTSEGILLGFPNAAERLGALPTRGERPLSFRDLGDADLEAFFASVHGASADAQLRRIAAPSGELLVVESQVGADPALDWRVAYLVPEAAVLGIMRSYWWESSTIAGIAAALAALLSLVCARFVFRVRLEARAARSDAELARSEARAAVKQAKELGSYRLVECLGKGGMGEVWLAELRLLARAAAIKMIRADSGVDGHEARERFRREAQTLASLRSRNTIELFDYGVAEDGTFYFVMELLEGLDLDHLVRRHGAQPVGRVLRILMQMCRSLGEAHEAGLVHRDVKPGNVFACRAADEVDVIKVLDFGLVHTARHEVSVNPELPADLQRLEAELEGQLTGAGKVMGTPECIAPEQALGEAVDGRADIYAFGCVAWFLLTGHAVFDRAKTAQAMLLAHIRQEPPRLREQLPDAPLELEELLGRCLAKRAEQRPESMHAIFVDLARIEMKIAADEVWTEERAHAWWRVHAPERAHATRATDDSPRYLHLVPKG